jgi:inhibitor of cysteine peptidase
MKKKLLIVPLILLMSLILSACQPGIPAEVETPSPSEDEYVYGSEVIVESLDVFILESFPVQVQVSVVGYLPDGCVELIDISVERDEMDFVLSLNTRRLTGDVACTEALVPFEEMVRLDVEGLEAGDYRVIAKDQEAIFRLDVDNVLPEDVDQIKYVYGSDATVESMTVNIMESFPVQVSVTLEGYFPDGCAEIEEITSSRDGSLFEIDIVTRRPSGDVACIMMLVPFSEVVNLDVEGLPAGEYTVQYGPMKETFVLAVDN